jgi:hypothetical protein
MSRVPDWPERLEALLREWQGLPFIWGQTDCVCFASAVVRSLTGRIPALGPEIYHGPATAREKLQKRGFANLAEAVSAELGLPQPPIRLQRGDLVMVRHGLGVLLGAKAAVRARKSGLLFVPLTEITQGWNV